VRERACVIPRRVAALQNHLIYVNELTSSPRQTKGTRGEEGAGRGGRARLGPFAPLDGFCNWGRAPPAPPAGSETRRRSARSSRVARVSPPPPSPPPPLRIALGSDLLAGRGSASGMRPGIPRADERDYPPRNRARGNLHLFGNKYPPSRPLFLSSVCVYARITKLSFADYRILSRSA